MKRIYALLALFAVSVSLGAPANKTLNIPIYENTATSFVGRAFTVSGNNNKVLGITGGDWALVSPLFGTSPTITTSILTDSTTFGLFNTTATTINAFGAATTLNVGTNAATVLNFGGAATAAQFRFLEPSGSGTNYTGFKAQAQAGNITYTLPAADGTNGQFLKTNGSGALSWATASGGGGGGLTGSTGGNGILDDGLAAVFDGSGYLRAEALLGDNGLFVGEVSTTSGLIYLYSSAHAFESSIIPNSGLAADEGYILPGDSGTLATEEWVAANTAPAAKRVITTTDDATAVIDVTATDVYQLSAVANATTFTLSGTAVDGQQIMVRIKDAGVAKSLTWTGFTAIGVTLPTTTTASKWTYVGCTYNAAATAWHVIAVTTES